MQCFVFSGDYILKDQMKYTSLNFGIILEMLYQIRQYIWGLCSRDSIGFALFSIQLSDMLSQNDSVHLK